MLNFNNSGLLVPDAKIHSSVEELEREFVTGLSAERKLLFDAYVNYSRQLKEVCGNTQLIQWINGSFVTKKERPNDIDLVTFIDHEVILNVSNLLESFSFPESERIYHVDAYIVPVYKSNHPKNYFYIEHGILVRNFWQNTKEQPWQ